MIQGQGAGASRPRPQLSFIVPTYQMAPYLALTLQSFRHLSAIPASYEVIVVDDGSDDGTAEVLESAATWLPSLRSVHRPRDARSCRSLARNVGVELSRSDRLFFVDAGVMLPGNLVQVLEASWTEPDDVVVVAALGLFAERAYADVSKLKARFESLPPGELEQLMGGLFSEPTWHDPRTPWFASTRGDLSQLPAPWLLAWSCSLGVSRTSFERVGGFDEQFLGWGAEDCDFALRLYQGGSRFRAIPGCAVMHVPHPHLSGAERLVEHRTNIRRLHEKALTRDSELFLVLMDPFGVNELVQRLESHRLEDLLPAWNASMHEALRSVVGSGNAVVVGAPTPELCGQHSHLDWVVPSWTLLKRLEPAVAPGSVSCLAAGHTSVQDKSQDVVVLTDLIRMLPRDLQAAQLREAVRVGKRAYVICSARPGDAETAQRREKGWPFVSVESLIQTAARAQIAVQRQGDELLRLHPLEQDGECPTF